MSGILIPRDEMNETFFSIELNGVVLSDHLKSLVTDIENEESDEEADLLRITIQDKDRYFLDRPELLEEGVSIKLYMGYKNHHPEEFSGVITHAEADFDTSGVPIITIGAVDKSVNMTAELKTREFKNATKSSIIKQIGAEYGYLVVATETEEIHESIKQDTESDAQFIKRLAEDEAFVWYLSEQDKRLFWGKRLPDNISIADTLNYNEGNFGIVRFQPMRVEKNKTIEVKSSQVDAVTGEEKTASSSVPIPDPQIEKTDRVLVIDGRDGRVSMD